MSTSMSRSSQLPEGSIIESGRDALNRALADEMERDPSVIVMGETVRHVGASGVTRGLFDRFGRQRVLETPVSENAIFGAALGLALQGFRPVVEIYSADFLLAVANELINDIAKWRQQQAIVGPLPITIRGCMGANGGLGPEHSQSMEPYFHHAPGLTVVTPGASVDMPGLLRASIRSDDPVIFLEHRRLYDMPAEVRDSEEVLGLGQAAVVTPGSDVTVVAWGWMRQLAEQASAELGDSGIEVELIDPRTIRPLDITTIANSVSKTSRLVVVEESPRTGSVAAEIMARVWEALPGRSDLRMTRVVMPDVIHPYSAALERHILPTWQDVVAAVNSVLEIAPSPVGHGG